MESKAEECRLYGLDQCFRERSKVVALYKLYSSEDAEVEETNPPNTLKLFRSANLISGVL
jgi:hypothetical protein